MLHKLSQQALADIKANSNDGRIVFVSGNFNILHPGHLRLLRFASECGDYLVVGVFGQTSSGTFLPEELRLESVQSINWVDHAFLMHDPPELFVKELQPAIVVKGKEHETQFNSEAEVVANYGGKLLFSSGDLIFSSVDLMRREWREFSPSTIRKPNDYLGRHGITATAAVKALNRMEGLRVCVIGDIIVDEYITCDPIGMSQEDPTIVVVPIHNDKFVGGAGIVAAHAKGLGAQVSFFSVQGTDETASYVRDTINSYGVEAHIHADDSRPTTLKQRFRAGNKTLLRVSHLRQHEINADLREMLFRDILAALDGADLVIFADFTYGTLPQSLVERVVSACSERGIMMAADSQSSSQVGDIGRFHGMALVTPTEREARLAVQDFDAGLVVLAEKLKQRASAGNVVITLGAEGILIHPDSEDWPTDRLPALNMAPKDVAGAGDSFLITASMALVSGGDIWMASYLGSLAAACQVGRVGNIPLTRDEIVAEIAE
jgi:rfaE bifunctional protein kinase chain/domain